jgi:hypothetical protein
MIKLFFLDQVYYLYKNRIYYNKYQIKNKKNMIFYCNTSVQENNKNHAKIRKQIIPI